MLWLSLSTGKPFLSKWQVEKGAKGPTCLLDLGSGDAVFALGLKKENERAINAVGSEIEL